MPAPPVQARPRRCSRRAEKLPLYAAHGVPQAWLVDPILCTLEVLRLENARWSLLGTHRDDAQVRAEPFDAFELDLSVLWADVVLPESGER